MEAPPSNFDFLTNRWTAFQEDARQAEQNAFPAPRTSAFYARRALEKAVNWLYANDRDLKPPYRDNLGAMLHEASFQDLLPRGLFQQARLIHRIGNDAVHSDIKLTGVQALQLTKAIHQLLRWIVQTYTDTGGAPLAIKPFNDKLLIQPAAPPPDRRAGSWRSRRSRTSTSVRPLGGGPSVRSRRWCG